MAELAQTQSKMIESKTSAPGVITGAIVGGVLMLPVIALAYLGNSVLEIPYVVDNFFAWVRDLLPGDVITTGIDFMVDSIRATNIGDTDSTAKLAEQMSAIGMIFGLGVVLGAILFILMQHQRRNVVMIIGVVAGLVFGSAMAIITEEKLIITNLINPETFTVGEALFVGGLFSVWAIVLAWVYNDLSELPTSKEKAAVTEASASGNSVQQLNRRQFLVRVGGASATLTVIGAGLSSLLSTSDEGGTAVASSISEPSGSSGGGAAAAEATPEAALAEATPEALPNATASLEPAPGTRPEYTPLDDHYRIDISTRPPRIRENEWVLLINGLVAQETVMTLADLRSYTAKDQFITLSCISNRIAGDLISTTRWTGVPLRDLLDLWGPQPEATHIKITSADGFDEYMDLQLALDDERVMLAYEWDGQPLKEKHGFPLRIYIPDHYGMKQPKWIIGIEFVAGWDEGYWVRRGWSEDARVRTVSVVDTVAVDDAYTEVGQDLVPIGGIAYAGGKGISKVEIIVNGGAPVEAELREPLSELTWVLWRYDWPMQDGQHTFEVIAYDGDGNVQITEDNSVRPDGATGIHSQRVSV